MRHDAPLSGFSTTRRKALMTAAGVAGAALVTDAGAARADTAAAPDAAATADDAKAPAARPFVKVANGGFTIGGEAFRFGGTNCYYLHQQSHYMIDAALDDVAAAGLAVVRAWAFADGSGHGFDALQPEPYQYDEAAFGALDYAVYKAGKLGLRLVLPLVNNWPDYGGMAQYVSWFLDLADDSYGDAVNHDEFYTTAAIKDCYKAYAKHVIERRNPYTGLRYRDDPTIMTWELANEPRNRSDKSGATVLAWVTEMSAYLKHLAPRQLVAVGDEGFYGDAAKYDYPYSTYEGDHWKEFIALPTVDYGTVHLYPQGWGETPSNHDTDPVAWGTQWIHDHLADGAAAGKPVVLEEYGLSVDGTVIKDEAARAAGYTAWTQAVLDGGGAGDQFWLLTSRVDDGSFYPDYDGYRVIWYNDASNPTNDLAKLLSAHAKAMAAAS